MAARSDARKAREAARNCPECHGTRTLDGITDKASAAAWLDCTTCTASPRADVHVLHLWKPPDVRVAVCGVAEHFGMSERLGYPTDRSLYMTCPICEQRAAQRAEPGPALWDVAVRDEADFIPRPCTQERVCFAKVHDVGCPMRSPRCGCGLRWSFHEGTDCEGAAERAEAQWEAQHP